MLLEFNLAPEISMPGDAEICENADFIISNVTVENYSTATWSSSGDGIFDDNSQLETTYTPGSNDIVNGSVTLSLTASALEGCDDVSDDLMLTIHATPVVELGVDTAICFDQTIVLDAGNPGSTYLWSTDETTQTIEASSGGEQMIITYWVEVTNDFECMESDEITITFEDCFGIAENNQSKQVQVVPNPNNGSFKIRFDLEINDPVDISVFNPLSGNVFERTNVKVDQINSLDVQLDQVTGGIYFLKISNKEVNILKKIIVQD
jgi:hypothetical protein